MQTKRAGFTLVEILVVISMLGILLSIVVFSGADAREGAKVTAEEATINQLNVAIIQYRAATGQFPPGVDSCTLCDLRNGNLPAAESNWGLVVAKISPDYINKSITVDTWGNPYAYDNNYQVGGSQYYTTLCSMGPDGELQTFLDSDVLDYEIVAGDPLVRGDDICFFAL
jgi:general secretion pathway protein G